MTSHSDPTIRKLVPSCWPTKTDAVFNTCVGCYGYKSTNRDMLTMARYGQDISVWGKMNCWDSSSITDMSSLFESDPGRPEPIVGFNEPIGCWDVSGVTTMSKMFRNAPDFNQDISNWNVNKVTDMYAMFN
jgi:surface protein